MLFLPSLRYNDSMWTHSRGLFRENVHTAHSKVGLKESALISATLYKFSSCLQTVTARRRKRLWSLPWFVSAAGRRWTKSSASPWWHKPVSHQREQKEAAAHSIKIILELIFNQEFIEKDTEQSIIGGSSNTPRWKLTAIQFKLFPKKSSSGFLSHSKCSKLKIYVNWTRWWSEATVTSPPEGCPNSLACCRVYCTDNNSLLATFASDFWTEIKLALSPVQQFDNLVCK